MLMQESQQRATELEDEVVRADERLAAANAQLQQLQNAGTAQNRQPLDDPAAGQPSGLVTACCSQLSMTLCQASLGMTAFQMLQTRAGEESSAIGTSDQVPAEQLHKSRDQEALSSQVCHSAYDAYPDPRISNRLRHGGGAIQYSPFIGWPACLMPQVAFCHVACAFHLTGSSHDVTAALRRQNVGIPVTHLLRATTYNRQQPGIKLQAKAHV